MSQNLVCGDIARGTLPSAKFHTAVRPPISTLTSPNVDEIRLPGKHPSRILRLVTGEEVRRLRRRLDLTQAQLAELVGVHKNSVARWERGEMGIRESAAKLMLLLAQTRSDTPGKGQRL